MGVVEAEGNVSLGFFGVDDSERDEATVIESVITKSSAVRVTIEGEEIEAKGRMLMVEVTERVIDLKIEGVVNFSRAVEGLYIHSHKECSSK